LVDYQIQSILPETLDIGLPLAPVERSLNLSLNDLKVIQENMKKLKDNMQ